MKKIDESKIIDLVKEEQSHYEIKLNSDEILTNYKIDRYKTQSKVSKKKVSRKLLGIGIGSLATAALAATIIGLVVVNNNKSNINGGDDNPTFVSPDSSNILTNELLTFASFNSSSSNTTTNLNLFKKSLNSVNNDKKNANGDSAIDEDTLKDAVSAYDEIYGNIENLFSYFDEVSTTHYQETFTYENNTYLYRTDFILDGSIISSLYYNDLTTYEQKDETINSLDALYHLDNTYYYAYIIQEIEVDKDETDDETSIIFVGNNEFFRVSKEIESERLESEESYTYAIYENEQDAYRDEDEIYKIEYSIDTENNKEEIELSIDDYRNGSRSEHEYKNITKISDIEYSFFIEYESNGNGRVQFSGYITLVINDDGSRTYTYGTISTTIS